MPHRVRRLLTVASLAGLVLAQQACASTDPEPVTGGGTTSAPAPSSSPSPSSAAAPAPAGDAELPGEDTQVLVHVANVDKDWSATYEGPITTGDGTDDGALFRLREASGGAYQIQALRFREEGGEWCAVAFDEVDAADRVSTKKCGENKFTLFTIEPTGQADEKGRPTFTIENGELGVVTYQEGAESLTLTKGEPTTAFSFVDKGEAVVQ